MEIDKSDIRGSFVIANNVYHLKEFNNIIQVVLKNENRFTKAPNYHFKHVANCLAMYIYDESDWDSFRKYLLYHNVRIFSCVPKEEATFVLKGFLPSNTSEEIQNELEKNASIPILQCRVMKNTKIPTCLVETTSDVTAVKLKQAIPTVFDFETKWSKYVSRMRLLYCLECYNWSTAPEDGFRKAQCLKCMETPIIVDMDSLVECEKCKTKHLGCTCPEKVEPSEEGESSSSESIPYNITSKFHFPELTQTTKPALSLSMEDFKYAKTVEYYLNVIEKFLDERSEVSSETEQPKTVWNKKKQRN